MKKGGDREKIIIYGTGINGTKAFLSLNNKYEIISWVDGDVFKQGLIYYSKPILSVNELIAKNSRTNTKVVIAIENYYEVYQMLIKYEVNVIGHFSTITDSIVSCECITWDSIKYTSPLRLYAGDLQEQCLNRYPDLYCLSITKTNYYTIRHDITNPYPLEDNSVDSYQSEDVAEHIDESLQVSILDEIYRVLKPGGIFRWSVPDYRCPYLKNRSFVNEKGEIIFDPAGGGNFVEGSVKNGGHVWFPTYEKIKNIVEKSRFIKYDFYRYYKENGELFSKEIDYKVGYISRVKEHDARNIDMSIVIDCIK